MPERHLENGCVETSKLMACLHWRYGRDKRDPDYVRAPHYFDAVYQWHPRLPIDGEELVGTVSKSTSRHATALLASGGAALWVASSGLTSSDVRSDGLVWIVEQSRCVWRPLMPRVAHHLRAMTAPVDATDSRLSV